MINDDMTTNNENKEDMKIALYEFAIMYSPEEEDRNERMIITGQSTEAAEALFEGLDDSPLYHTLSEGISDLIHTLIRWLKHVLGDEDLAMIQDRIDGGALILFLHEDNICTLEGDVMDVILKESRCFIEDGTEADIRWRMFRDIAIEELGQLNEALTALINHVWNDIK